MKEVLDKAKVSTRIKTFGKKKEIPWKFNKFQQFIERP